MKKINALLKDCVFIELMLPMSPILLEWGLRTVIPALGPFSSYPKSFAIAGMMLPFVLAIRSTGTLSKLFGILMLFGGVVFTAVVCMSLVSSTQARALALRHLYYCSLAGIAFTGVMRFTTKSFQIFATQSVT